jgi:hypothetical protein
MSSRSLKPEKPEINPRRARKKGGRDRGVVSDRIRAARGKRPARMTCRGGHCRSAFSRGRRLGLRVKPGFGKPRFLSTGTEGGKSPIGRWARFHIPGVVGSSGASADSSPASTNPLEGLSELSARAAAPRAALAHASGRGKGGQKRTMVRFWGRGAGARAVRRIGAQRM